MALKDQIEAHLANNPGLSDEEKGRNISRIKSQGIRGELQGKLPLTLNNGNISVVIQSGVLDGDNISLVLSVTKNGSAVKFNNPLIIVNPPILVPDSLNPGLYVENPFEAVKMVVTDVVSQILASE